jgi:hypothetical protein
MKNLQFPSIVLKNSLAHYNVSLQSFDTTFLKRIHKYYS